jgi:hypothetical protein
MNKETTPGVTVGNCGFFPDHLCDTARKAVLDVLAQEGIRTMMAVATAFVQRAYGPLRKTPNRWRETEWLTAKGSSRRCIID